MKPVLLPTSGRTIHWLSADAQEHKGVRVLFVTGLDYGPNVQTAILARDFTEGDPFNTNVSADAGVWHYADDCPNQVAKR